MPCALAAFINCQRQSDIACISLPRVTLTTIARARIAAAAVEAATATRAPAGANAAASLCVDSLAGRPQQPSLSSAPPAAGCACLPSCIHPSSLITFYLFPYGPACTVASHALRLAAAAASAHGCPSHLSSKPALPRPRPHGLNRLHACSLFIVHAFRPSAGSRFDAAVECVVTLAILAAPTGVISMRRACSSVWLRCGGARAACV